jgi:PAS domain S-box-containing protein
MVGSPRGPSRAAPAGRPGWPPVSDAALDTIATIAELERLRTVTSLMTAAVSQCSRDLRYRWVSPGYGTWIGREPEAIVGRWIVDVLGSDAFEALRPHFERVLAGERVEYEQEADFAGIGRRIVRAVYLPTCDASGAPDGWVAMIDDLTERRKLEASHARLAAIVESSDDAIVGKTLDGIVTSWNRGAEALFGYTAAEMIGQPISRLVPPDIPDDAAHILATIRRGSSVDHYETERIRKDGRRVAVSVTVSPIRNAAGTVVGASKIARNVTERRRAEQARRETLDVLETLNRTSSILSAELDMEKLVQAVTDAASELIHARFGAFFYNKVDGRGESYTLFTLSGVPREAFSRFPLPRNTALFAPTFRGDGVVRIADVTRDPRYGQSAPYHGLPPGHLPVCSYLAVPVVSRGVVYGGLFFGHPEPGRFTERDERLVVGLAAQAAVAISNARLYEAERVARAEAEAASRAKDALLSVVSHELRTPLTAMLGWVSVLRQAKLPPDRVARALQTIDQNGRVQAALIDDLLDVSRIVTGRLHIEFAAVDLRAVLEAALDGIRPAAAVKGVRLASSLAADATVSGDAIRLRQVVSNVLSNAVKFTPAGSGIEVRLERHDRTARVVVRDEGAGIAPEFLPHVFEPFWQAEAGRLRKGGGLGLGLAIAQNLAGQHGGRVTVESAGPGQGATFTVELPLRGVPIGDVSSAAAPERVR